MNRPRRDQVRRRHPSSLQSQQYFKGFALKGKQKARSREREETRASLARSIGRRPRRWCRRALVPLSSRVRQVPQRRLFPHDLEDGQHSNETRSKQSFERFENVRVRRIAARGGWAAARAAEKHAHRPQRPAERRRPRPTPTGEYARLAAGPRESGGRGRGQRREGLLRASARCRGRCRERGRACADRWAAAPRSAARRSRRCRRRHRRHRRSCRRTAGW